MKTLIHSLTVALLLPCLLISCAGLKTTSTVTRPNGEVAVEDTTLAQLGGKLNFVKLPDGTTVYASDMDKAFGAGVAAGAAALAGYFWADLGKTRALADAATSQIGIKTAGATTQAGIKATADAAKTLGSNPEANTSAINAVGNLKLVK
jgi:hypothetical protein